MVTAADASGPNLNFDEFSHSDKGGPFGGLFLLSSCVLITRRQLSDQITMASQASNYVIRIKPYHYIHVLDQNTFVVPHADLF